MPCNNSSALPQLFNGTVIAPEPFVAHFAPSAFDDPAAFAPARFLDPEAEETTIADRLRKRRRFR